MGKPIWSLWARFMALGSTICIIPGAIISFWYPGQLNPLLTAYGLSIGTFVLVWEWPMPGLTALKIVFTNLYIRAFLYLTMSALLFFDAPTTAGGLALASTGVVYLMGAITGEQWQHPNDYNTRSEKDTKPRVVEVVHAEETPVIVEHESARVLSTEMRNAASVDNVIMDTESNLQAMQEQV